MMHVFLSLLALFASSIPAVVIADDEKFHEVQVAPNLKFHDSTGRILYHTPEDEHHRSVRRSNACKFPTAMSDSQLDCKLYPSKVVCTQSCMFGHTLSDGIQREMKCSYDENKWKPTSEFEKCQPFVDCGVTLGPGGKYKCYSNYMDKGTVCDISCAHYEDKAAVPTAKYECNIDGKWSPKLPFCARAGSGVKLVPPPLGSKIILPK